MLLEGPPQALPRWRRRWQRHWRRSCPLLLLAGTGTAAVPGISAAGLTPDSRRFTAAADAELLLLGPSAARPHALPPLPAGVSPALISWVVSQRLALVPLVIDAGAPTPPGVPHVRMPGAEPARCLSTGNAMDPATVAALLGWGRRWGAALQGRPLLLAECVPGGTSTAAAVLTGLGLDCAACISGSLREPPRTLRRDLVQRGLARAGLSGPAGRPSPAPADVLAAVGDPMLALAAGLVIGAGGGDSPILLAGGSQMAAVFAAALALSRAPERARLGAAAAVVTTSWLAQENAGAFAGLMERLGERWGVAPMALASRLSFHRCRNERLRDYERGYIKEGVGAGGFALLWELSGRVASDLAGACDSEAPRMLLTDSGQPADA
ncbi:nicotinate-nucleotide--dimethylbenzimidazole phosphoribosyltransferase [Synechococcus sp. RSCCF101]|uniref:nicotinate-nucleotide--dimethylbenzimidazole phosphoribosyltransferase n=1 Tax=Synechococcus sp. RSCCF101 TaxID=2511069 RepID=UPI0012466098|nr:nicotinate-nucleotide--dimethylbenzimidazole phosphoribosyltransferase [Synechococcus sp. RSCCF101]QEY30938.1 nicotinate-nucleotide--dimethylbenzimidazole phosphoribosyltransferase [Synechococcus sp. RSCCF101]